MGPNDRVSVGIDDHARYLAGAEDEIDTGAVLFLSYFNGGLPRMDRSSLEVPSWLTGCSHGDYARGEWANPVAPILGRASLALLAVRQPTRDRHVGSPPACVPAYGTQDESAALKPQLY